MRLDGTLKKIWLPSRPVLPTSHPCEFFKKQRHKEVMQFLEITSEVCCKSEIFSPSFSSPVFGASSYNDFSVSLMVVLYIKIECCLGDAK